MPIRLVHENVFSAIITQLEKSRNSIKVSVAWFTNPTYFTVLSNLAKKGIKVEVIISDHEFNLKKAINTMIIFGVKLFILSKIDNAFMHNKFCVIDNTTVITGSFNWSISAETNFENIVIVDDNTLALEYEAYFIKMRNISSLVSNIEDFSLTASTNHALTFNEDHLIKLAKKFEKEAVSNVEKSKRYIK